MSALEAGDTTFVQLKPLPPSLDYTCGACGQKLTSRDYSVTVLPDTKLLITARHCGQEALFKVWINYGGVLFEGAPKQRRKA